MTLGERLKQARLARNMSLSALARLSGLSKGFLSQIESGATNPSLNSLQRLAQALTFSISDLVSTDELPPSITVAQRPSLVRRVHPERDRSSLQQIGTSSQGAIYVAHLLAGSSLEAVTPWDTDDAYLMVLAGEIEFSQPGTSLRLQEGDSLTFPIAAGYRLAAPNRFRSSLLLMLRSERDLPRVVDTPFREIVRGTRGIEVPPSEGPLRLVAMRAARAAERGR